jgi:arylsulfatase A-like enzyme
MGNKTNMLLAGVVAGSVAAAGTVSAGDAAPERAKPNIILFVVDDMGWQDTSVPFYSRRTPFNDRYRTPNMERLAAQGMKFTDYYAAGPVCTPTRVSMMTGWNPARTRVTNWTLRRDADTSGPHAALTLPDWNVNGLSSTPETPRACFAPALPAILRANGYRTIHVGKAHFGALGTPGEDPHNLGFDINIAGHAAGAPGSYLAEEGYGKFLNKDHVWDVPGLDKYYRRKTFLTEALTIEANREIDRAAAEGKPFFMNMAHYAVHVPFAADDRFFQKYLDAGLDRTEAMYAALIEGMDFSLGKIMDNLERHGIADNTILLFVSDNGGLSAHGRGGEKNTHNAPLKSGKGSAYEGGIRVPLLVKWPGVVRPGSVCHAPVISDDLFATILNMAEVPDAGKYVRSGDGVDLAPLLRQTGNMKKDRALLWHYPHVWGAEGPGIAPFSAVRVGDWKLIYFHADRRCELYNLAEDIGENHNLAAAQPDRVKRLAGVLRRRLKETGAQMPVEKATGQPVPLPEPEKKNR